jgi:hypothetical protein
MNIAIGDLRHLRPAQIRQLYQACVTLIMDYVLAVWHNPLKNKIHLKTFNIV